MDHNSEQSFSVPHSIIFYALKTNKVCIFLRGIWHGIGGTASFGGVLANIGGKHGYQNKNGDHHQE